MLQRPNTTVVSIDLGTPIAEEIVLKNVERLNVHKNKYTYLKGNSQSELMVGSLKEIVEGIDILFIDGDHSYQGVINDFNLYKDLVKVGGYIIFDDYNDHECSPEVKGAVNQIVEIYCKEYNVIGTIKNTLGARPDSLLEGNDYIIQKI
jgi:cephalosporin hydroxylase